MIIYVSNPAVQFKVSFAVTESLVIVIVSIILSRSRFLSTKIKLKITWTCGA